MRGAQVPRLAQKTLRKARKRDQRERILVSRKWRNEKDWRKTEFCRQAFEWGHGEIFRSEHTGHKIYPPYVQGTKKAPTSVGALNIWCARRDLNSHKIALASPSSWCVCRSATRAYIIKDLILPVLLVPVRYSWYTQLYVQIWHLAEPISHKDQIAYKLHLLPIKWSQLPTLFCKLDLWSCSYDTPFNLFGE